MVPRLDGKVAVVTGAGRGIGRIEALALAAEGARVLVNDIGCAMDGSGFSKSQADAVAAEIREAGGKAVANYETVATAEGAERIVSAAINCFGALDILVNNAGNVIQKPFPDLSEEDFTAILRVHLYGHFNCSRFACAWFRDRWQKTGAGGGRIINTSSIVGVSGTDRTLGPGLGGIGVRGISVERAAYAAAKQGILGLTRVIALEMSGYGVTCNAIVPSAATRVVRELTQPREKQIIGSKTSRLGALSAEDIGLFVAYLASDDAAGLNGLVFRVLQGQIGIYGNDNPFPVTAIRKTGGWTIDELCDAVPEMLASMPIPRS